LKHIPLKHIPINRIPIKYIISSVLVVFTIILLTRLIGCGRAELPISVISARKYTDTKGSQQLNIIIKNTSQDYTITSAELYVKCYSTQGTLLEDRSNGQDVYNCTYSDCQLTAGQLSSEDLYFNYGGFDDIGYCEIAVKKVLLSDGTELSIDTDSLDYIKFSIESTED